MALNEGACPSRFPRRISPRKRPPPTVRTVSTPRTKMQGLEESLRWIKNLLVHFVDLVWIHFADSYESLKEQLQQAEAEITSLNEQTRLLKENLQTLEEQIERLCKETEVLKSRRFVLLLMARSTWIRKAAMTCVLTISSATFCKFYISLAIYTKIQLFWHIYGSRRDSAIQNIPMEISLYLFWCVYFTWENFWTLKFRMFHFRPLFIYFISEKKFRTLMKHSLSQLTPRKHDKKMSWEIIVVLLHLKVSQR